MLCILTLLSSADKKYLVFLDVILVILQSTLFNKSQATQCFTHHINLPYQKLKFKFNMFASYLGGHGFESGLEGLFYFISFLCLSQSPVEWKYLEISYQRLSHSTCFLFFLYLLFTSRSSIAARVFLNNNQQTHNQKFIFTCWTLSPPE